MNFIKGISKILGGLLILAGCFALALSVGYFAICYLGIPSIVDFVNQCNQPVINPAPITLDIGYIVLAVFLLYCVTFFLYGLVGQLLLSCYRLFYRPSPAELLANSLANSLVRSMLKHRAKEWL